MLIFDRLRGMDSDSNMLDTHVYYILHEPNLSSKMALSCRVYIYLVLFDLSQSHSSTPIGYATLPPLHPMHTGAGRARG